MRRTWTLFGFLATLLGAVGIGYLSAPALAGWLITQGLNDQGFPGARLRVSDLGLTHLRIVDLDLGPEVEVSADSIDLQFSPARLVNGVVDGVTITRPSFALGVSAQGIDAGKLAPFLEPSSDQDEMSWQLQGPLKIAAADILLRTPFGDVGTAATGEALFTESIGSTIDFDIALAHPDAELRGTVRGVIGPDGEGRGKIDIDRASSRAALSFSKLSGSLSVSGNFPDKVAGTTSLTLRDAGVDGVMIGDMDFAGTLDGTAATASFLLAGDRTGLTVEVTARSPNILDAGSRVILGGSIATDGLRGPIADAADIDALGTVDFTLQGARKDLQFLADSLAAGNVHASGPVTGWLEARQFSLRTGASDAQIDGLGALRVGPAGWQFRPSGDILIDLETAFGDRRHQLAMALRAINDDPFLSGGVNPLAPLRINVATDAIIDDQIAVSGALGGNIWADAPVSRFEDVVFRLDPLGTKIGDMDIVFEGVTARLNGPVDALAANIVGDALFSGLISPEIGIDGGRLSLQTALHMSDEDIVVDADGCQELRVVALRSGTANIRPGPISICSFAENGDLIRIARDVDGVRTVDIAAAVRAFELSVENTAGTRLLGTTPGFQGRLGYDMRRGTWWASADVSGGSMTAEPAGLMTRDLVAKIEAEGAPALVGARAKITDMVVSDARQPQRAPPLRVNGQGIVADGTWRWDGNATVIDGPTVQVSARHRPQEGRGRLSASMADWRMIEGQPDVTDFFPDLAGSVTSVRGQVSADARLDWAPRGMSSSGRLQLKDLTVKTPNVDVEGISADFVFADLLDPKTEGPQSLTVRRVDAGIPLFGGVVAVDLPGQGRVEIPEAKWPLAGGRLAIRNIVLSPDEPFSFLNASLEGLDGGTLATLLDIDGFEADGTLSGQIPLRLTDDGPVIENARLRAVRDGHLRFRSPAAVDALKGQGGSAELLAQALEDFRYTELELNVDGPLTGEISARATIKGANPALYEGKRIDLNVNLTGDLRELLQSASVISDVPAAIQDQMQSPGGAP